MPIRTFPSGTIFDLRVMEGDELIAATETARRKDAAGALFGTMPRCITRVESPGPYNFMKTGDTAVAEWQKMLIGDGIMGLAFMRELSVPDGDLIEDPQAHKCPECGTINFASFEVAKLRTKPLPQASLDRFASGDPWFSMMCGKDEIRYELPRVADAIAVPGLLAEINKQLKAEGKAPRSEPTAVETVALTLRAVNGTPITDPMKRWAYARKMPTPAIFNMIALQDEQTCGIELEEDLLCREPTCRAVSRIAIPLAPTMSILSPGKKRAGNSSLNFLRDTSSSASTPSSGAPTGPATSPTPARS